MITADVGRTEALGRFVSCLEDLTLAQLAIFRRANGKPLGSDVAIYDLFNEIWRPLRRKAQLPKWAFYLTAVLYPWDNMQGGRRDLPSTLQLATLKIVRKLPAAAKARFLVAEKTRFLLLVESQGEALTTRLAQSVRYLASQDTPISWRVLLVDLCDWYEPGHPAQERWMNSYFNSHERK